MSAIITAKQYINLLQKVVDKHGDLPLCYSSDDEGNEYHLCYIGPEAGHYTNTGEFHVNNPDTDEVLPITHICMQ